MITPRKGSSGNSGMILPDSGKSSSLRKTVSECCRKLIAAEGLSRRIYADNARESVHRLHCIKNWFAVSQNLKPILKENTLMESLIQTPNIWVFFSGPFVANIFDIIFNLSFLHKIGNKDFRRWSSFATFTQMEHLPAIIGVYR